MTIRPLRILFKTAVIGSGLTAGAVGLSNLANMHLEATTPTPAEFALKQGMSYSAETMARLREFDHARVIELGSKDVDRFCRINPLSCNLGQAVRSAGAFAYTPKTIANILGTGQYLFLHPYTGENASDTIHFATGKRPETLTEQHSVMSFTFSLLHETGHLKQFRDEGSKRYHNHPVQHIERYADQQTMPLMKVEFGQAGTDYAKHLRNLTQYDYHHDTRVGLDLHRHHSHEAAEGAHDFSEYRSWALFAGAKETCLSAAIDSGKNPQAADVHDITYLCLKAEQTGGAARHDSPLLAERKGAYISSYEYFFGRPTP